MEPPFGLRQRDCVGRKRTCRRLSASRPAVCFPSLLRPAALRSSLRFDAARMDCRASVAPGIANEGNNVRHLRARELPSLVRHTRHRGRRISRDDPRPLEHLAHQRPRMVRSDRRVRPKLGNKILDSGTVPTVACSALIKEDRCARLHPVGLDAHRHGLSRSGAGSDLWQIWQSPTTAR